jgi:hypothetical protein
MSVRMVGMSPITGKSSSRSASFLIGPAGKGSGDKRFLFTTRSTIVAVLQGNPGTIGPPAHWLATQSLHFLHFLENGMNKFAISLALGASALLISAASAAPLSPDVSVVPASNVQNVRMVCNENGRCWRERGERRVIIREPGDSYGYAPRERYIDRRGYDEDRGPGIGFRAPGVSVGIGTDRY